MEQMNRHARRALLRALIRKDFLTFVAKVFETVRPGELYHSGWHIESLAWYLLEALAGRKHRLIVNLPPRSLKSVMISVALPAWILAHNPSKRIIVVSYSDALARTHSRDFRTVVTSGWYRDAFPEMQIDPNKNTESEIATTRRGFRWATSIGGTLTGRGGDIIIIDDPMKQADATSEAERARVNEFFDTTLFTRIDDKDRGIIIVVMHRLHEDDLTGHLLAKGGFKQVVLPAIAPEDAQYPIGNGQFHARRAGEPLHPSRESLATLDGIKATVGSANFAAQYQQNPMPAGGNMFQRTWIQRYDKPPQKFRMVVQSWDAAAKIGESNDYSVCSTFGLTDNGHHYLLDVHRGRYEFPHLLRLVQDLAIAKAANRVLIEDASNGTALIQSLRTHRHLNVVAFKSSLEKEVRAAQQSAQVEAGRLWVPNNSAWLAEWEHEVLGFPQSKHDDQVDSMVQYLTWYAETEANRPPIVKPLCLMRSPDDPNDYYWR